MTHTARTLESFPQTQCLSGDTARAAAVAKFRQLADQLERGELDGARIQWRDGLHHLETVELTDTKVSLLRYEIHSSERPDNYNEPNIGEEPNQVDQILSQVDLKEQS